jgi:hyaluronan synthase
LTERCGKRLAQAEGFRRSRASFIVTLDSDTVLDPDALAHLLEPFEDVRVMAVMGNIAASNRNANLLTRVAASRARHGIVGPWAMQSFFGAVLCTWGAFSAYRREVITHNLDDYLNERFGGRRVESGDDRRLTFFALQRGRVVLAKNALAKTLMPDRANDWLLQQLRWSRNYLRTI